jgi:hypothetical protein
MDNQYFQVDKEVYDQVFAALEISETRYPKPYGETKEYVLRNLFQRVVTGERKSVKLPLHIDELATPLAHIQYGLRTILQSIKVSPELSYYDVLAPVFQDLLIAETKTVTYYWTHEYDEVIKVRVLNTPLPKETHQLLLYSIPTSAKERVEPLEKNQF